MASGNTSGLSHRKPIRKIFPVCCARAVSGPHTATQLTSRMNSRRRILLPQGRGGTDFCNKICQKVTIQSSSRSAELKYCFEEFLDCLFGLLRGDRIVPNVHAVNDAGVRVGEWPPGVGVDEKSV